MRWLRGKSNEIGKINDRCIRRNEMIRIPQGATIFPTSVNNILYRLSLSESDKNLSATTRACSGWLTTLFMNDLKESVRASVITKTLTHRLRDNSRGFTTGNSHSSEKREETVRTHWRKNDFYMRVIVSLIIFDNFARSGGPDSSFPLHLFNSEFFHLLD